MTPKVGKPYIVRWAIKRDLTGFLGGQDVCREFDNREEAVQFFADAKRRFESEDKNNFVVEPTFYKRDQDADL
jgi:hypothetical protein